MLMKNKRSSENGFRFSDDLLSKLGYKTQHILEDLAASVGWVKTQQRL